MTLNGTLIGFICVIALLLASLLIAFIDRKEKSRLLSRTALILFLLSFIGGVALTLSHGIKPREDGIMSARSERPVMGMPPESPDHVIGEVDTKKIKVLEDKIAKNPKDIKSREQLGHIYLQQQDYENAFKMSHEALQIDPKSAESRVHLGMVLFAMQQNDKALQQLNQALQIDPKQAEAQFFKGIVLQMMDSQRSSQKK